MKGVLSPEQQLVVLGRVWGRDRDGFVFLPWIDGTANTTARRRKGYHEGRAYEWPRERDAILAHLQAHTGDDLYFTPGTFNAKRRTEQMIDSERTLWADLDPVDPRGLGELRPTIAWETSPGRYQAVWVLNEPRTGASWPSKENHRLSLHVGADPSGWDSTQLLRVPGRPNFKFGYRGEEGDELREPVTGQLLWDNGPRYTWDDFDELPAVGAVTTGDDVDLLDEDLLAGIDRHDLWARVRLKVSHTVREYMASRTADGADRSDVLWQVERDLADAGCSLVEIIALVRPTVWNKYAGRNDELRRLKIEAAKAIAATKGGADDDGSLEAVEEVAKPSLAWLADIVSRPIPRPRWLVRDVWTEGGCGFIAGAPKSYKSWMGLELAVSVATGTPFLGDAGMSVPRARPVLILQEEDDLRLVMGRLASVVEAKAPELYWHGGLSLGPESPETRRASRGGGTQGSGRAGTPAGPSSVYWSPPEADIPLALHVQAGFIASDPGWQAWLADVVAEGQFGLVLIDTLGTTAGDIDTDRSGDVMTKLLKPLKVVAKDRGCGLALVHHNRKVQDGSKGRAGNDMLGSVALHAWVDCALYARSKEASSPAAAGGASSTEVMLEREAKLAPDLSLRVRVPRMFESLRSGDRMLWSPEIIPYEAASVGGPGGVADEVKARRESSTGKGVGASLVVKMKGSGRGPHTEEFIRDVLGVSRATLRGAVEAGRVAEVDGGYVVA